LLLFSLSFSLLFSSIWHFSLSLSLSLSLYCEARSEKTQHKKPEKYAAEVAIQKSAEEKKNRNDTKKERRSFRSRRDQHIIDVLVLVRAQQLTHLLRRSQQPRPSRTLVDLSLFLLTDAHTKTEEMQEANEGG